MSASTKTKAWAIIYGIDLITLEPELEKIVNKLSFADILFLAQKQGDKILKEVWEIVQHTLPPKKINDFKEKFKVDNGSFKGWIATSFDSTINFFEIERKK